MPRILDIAQVGVGVSDRAGWEQYCQEVLGFPAFRAADGAVTYVRWDAYHHRLALRDAADAQLHYVAFDVGSAEAMEEWSAHLASKQLAVRLVDTSRCRDRMIAGAIEFQDPDGHPLALGYGFEVAQEPVPYTRPLSVLRTGHVLLTAQDTKRSHDFYTELLGFRLSDWIHRTDDMRLCFLRVNSRHHTLALAPCRPGSKPRLQHIMVEVESLDDVMRSYHHAKRLKAPIGRGPGKHPNCQTIHLYLQTPGGFAIEFGYGHRRLDDAIHQPVIYPPGTPGDVWGGQVQSAEFVLG
ncbi:MAG: VOC family protein [Candidatus Rokubacteria bacterium]|nr:VOC family protein [Candidatus Rokubacteria bacterium]